MKIHPLLLALALALVGTGCQENSKDSTAPRGNKSPSGQTLPSSNGSVLEVLVVAEESLWNSVAGDAFRKYFTRAQYGLPQPEPRFAINQVSPDQFSNILKRTRNVVRFRTVDAPPQIRIRSNIYAYPQTVLELQARNAQNLAQAIKQKEDTLRNAIRKREIRELQKEMRSLFSEEKQPVLQKHQVELKIPRDFDREVEEDNLLVFWKKTRTSDQGLIIHFRPFTGESAALGEDIIPLRDSLTRIHIQGEDPGSYMVTETIIKPRITPEVIDGSFALEARGLWRTTETIMGGSFLSYTVFDEKHDQIIYLDAFLFAPNQKKRSDLLRLEAILKTLDIQ